MAEELAIFKTATGEPYKLLTLPLPKAIYNEEGIRLPATYANFLIINQAVLVPIYNDPANDDIALEQLSECFPDREIIAIDCTPLIHQFGSLHCVAMQLPKGVI
jgi:agmatine/peptidylarginine deiminase